MFIQQLKKYPLNLITYLPIPLGFILLMLWNYVASIDVNTNEMIHQTINLVGVNGTFLIMVAPLAFGLLIVWFWSKFIQNISIRELTTARKKVDWKRIFFSFFLWASVTILLIVGSYYATPENFIWNLKWDKFIVFAILAIVLVPMQTSFEEYLFRGHLMQGLGLATNSKLIPLLVSSFLFGIMHAANPEVDKVGPIIMLYYIGTGLFLGIITLMDDGLELALGFHAANNLVSALLVTADWTAFQTHSVLKDISNPSTGFEIILPVFIIFPTLLFIFSKVYKWHNWKDKLMGKLTNEEV